MTGTKIVREETKRMARCMAPLTVIAFGMLVLAGFAPIQIGFSLLLGACYSVILFWMIGRSAAKAVLFSPDYGTRIVRLGYVFRYVLTGVLVAAAIKAPVIQPFAAILPLFFPKGILLWQATIHRKEAGRCRLR